MTKVLRADRRCFQRDKLHGVEKVMAAMRETPRSSRCPNCGTPVRLKLEKLQIACRLQSNRPVILPPTPHRRPSLAHNPPAPHRTIYYTQTSPRHRSRRIKPAFTTPHPILIAS
eukprot:GFKZ01003784.1.p2 GENE.GFKZ01003784.1~~GFKZ01003784.1.p2  ORF type:complete len:114 (-),score=4.69 GFKZ01003784.1:80-421(-)